MIDCLVVGICITDASVSGPFVGKDGFGVRLPQNNLMQSLTSPIVCHPENDFTTTLHHTNYQSLVTFVSPAFAFRFATYKGFVHFDNAVKGFVIFSGLSHCVTNTVRQVPSGLIGHSQFPLKLVRRHTFLGLDNGVDRQKPLPKGQVSVMENRSSGYREAIAA
jgi:hypothetical protein